MLKFLKQSVLISIVFMLFFLSSSLLKASLSEEDLASVVHQVHTFYCEEERQIPKIVLSDADPFSKILFESIENIDFPEEVLNTFSENRAAAGITLWEAACQNEDHGLMKRGLYFLLKACEDDECAQYFIAFCKEAGFFLHQDLPGALDLYKKSNHEFYFPAMVGLYGYHASLKEEDHALRFLRTALQKDPVQTLMCLMTRCEMGVGIPESDRKASEFLNLATAWNLMDGEISIPKDKDLFSKPQDAAESLSVLAVRSLSRSFSGFMSDSLKKFPPRKSKDFMSPVELLVEKGKE